MPKFRVTPIVYASLPCIEVEANNKKQAAEKAQELFDGAEQLCWHCANSFELGDDPIFSEEYAEEIE